MEREGEAAGGRVTSAHLVCLCCGGGWKASSFCMCRNTHGNSIETNDDDNDDGK